MWKLFHYLQRAIEFFWRNIAYADAFTNVSDQRNSLLSVTMLFSILAALPSQFGLQVWRIGWQIQRFHALEDTLDCLSGDETTKVADDTAEETIDVDGFTVHNV